MTPANAAKASGNAGGSAGPLRLKFPLLVITMKFFLLLLVRHLLLVVMHLFLVAWHLLLVATA